MSKKVLAAYIVHYGKEFFRASLKSVKDHVDEIAIFYTSTPSHGSKTHKKNPDSRSELRAIAHHYGCTWIDIPPTSAENKHRQMYINYGNRNGFDQILVVDSDEIHVSEEIPKLLESAANTGALRVGVRGSQWLTPWKSLNEYVTDGFSPIRVMNLKESGGEEHISEGFIYHMGYCISDELMEYKISCHGHRADFERNHNWFKEKWLGYKKGVTKYLHPATDAYWIETEDLDKDKLPNVLKEHPIYNK